MRLFHKIFFVFFIFQVLKVGGQYIPTHITNTGIYDFIDELADQQIIDINTAIKPYARKLIYDKLMEASEHKELLTERQARELDFYLQDYSKILPRKQANELTTTGETVRERESNATVRPVFAWINKPADQRLDLFYYQDSSFNITVNPILGANLWSNRNGTFHHWWNGIETWAARGGFSMYASVRDNHESTELTNRDFMNQRIGASNLKLFGGGKRDYWEVRGGMAYEWNWGHIALVMDQFSWGDNYNGSNIFSGRTPAFARLDLQLDPVDWLSVNYVHGWLISEVVDSTLSFWVSNGYGSDYREVYHPKFLAANMLTFKPFRQFYIGVGNSIIYDFRTPHAAFFIPVMFWKPLDHTLSARINNMNSQIFLTISSRNLKGLHLYGSVFIDEVQVGRIFREGEYNFTSFKAGAGLNALQNTTLRFEYTWSNALVFRHDVPTTTFESNQYNLGYFLEDNSENYFAALEYKPLRALKLSLFYQYSQKGPDHTLLGSMPRASNPPLDPIVWRSVSTGISASCQIINDLYLRLGYQWRNVSGEQDYIEMWTPEVYWGKTGTLNLGINYGF